MHGAIEASALRAIEQSFQAKRCWDGFLTGLFKTNLVFDSDLDFHPANETTATSQRAG
jgi:hypothetical protein